MPLIAHSKLPSFQRLKKQGEIILSKNRLNYVAQINPDSFARWVFPRLIKDRLAKYQSLADQYGYTIKSNDLYHCHSSDDVINLIAGALD